MKYKAVKPTMTLAEFEQKPVLLDKFDAGALIGMRPDAVLRGARDGSIPGVKVGRVWRFNKYKLAELAGVE